MKKMYVSYPGDRRTRFDRTYYVASHLPLVRDCWGPYGLVACAAFFPTEGGSGTVAVAECTFRDDAALRAALAAPETARVMADVKTFTDSTPEQGVAESP